MFDDIFFVGTAINLSEGGGLRNPYIQTWINQFATDKFYVQPPFYAYMLSGWIQVFGVSEKSFLAFQGLCSLGVALGAMALAFRAGVGRFLALTISLIVSTSLVRHGMRADAAGLLLSLLAAIGWTGTGKMGWTAGSLFGAAAPLVHPFATAFVVPVLAWRLIVLYFQVGRKGVLVGLALSAAALALVCAIFLWSIGGDLGEFVRVFKAHADLRTTSNGEQWHVVWTKMRVGLEPLLRWPALMVLIGALYLAAKKRELRVTAASTAMIFVWYVVVAALIYPSYIIHQLYVFAAAGAAFAGHKLVGRDRLFFYSAWSSAVVLMFSANVVAFAMQQHGRIDTSRMRTQCLAYSVAGKKVLLDEFAARYVFNWRLPPNSEDWLHCHWSDELPPPVPLRRKPEDHVWVVDAGKLEAYVPDTNVSCERVRIFGHVTTFRKQPFAPRLLE